MSSSSKRKEQKQKAEEKFHKLENDHVITEALVDKKNCELIEVNKLLQAEIIERKRIEAEIIEITQAEQRRFGSQLHDGLCQELTAILIFSKSLSQRVETNKTFELTEIKKISDMLLNAVDQARNTARGLYPGDLEGALLMHSLEELASHSFGVSCGFYCPEPILIDDNTLATHLYRIAQEGIGNAVKHGKAQHVEVSFTQNKEYITLTIKDDGIGMVKDAKKIKGIGLKIMQYRSHIIDANFQIKANEPHGVVIECIFKKPAPLPATDQICQVVSN
ncbi:MAG: hypothetical protein HQM16_03660 [Deltaproteobacteria bacterium]|nr:hypothetical protein [Deltaproteobacteria bacterium]